MKSTRPKSTPKIESSAVVAELRAMTPEALANERLLSHAVCELYDVEGRLAVLTQAANHLQTELGWQREPISALLGGVLAGLGDTYRAVAALRVAIDHPQGKAARG